MRKKRFFMQLGLALLLALAASFFVLKWMGSGEKPVVRTVPVIVSAKSIAPGTPLLAEHLTIARMEEKKVPEGVFGTADELLGKSLLVALTKGEPVKAGYLVSEPLVTGVSAMINPGNRAMAVRGNIVLGMSGYVRPGDRVDVLVTFEGVDNRQKVKTKLILENVRVLATGTELEPDEEGKPLPVDVYTLEVTPEESERLALASSQGVLHFALRNADDAETVLTEGVSMDQALKSFLSKKKRAKARKARERVEVINGEQRSVVTF